MLVNPLNNINLATVKDHNNAISLGYQSYKIPIEAFHDRLRNLSLSASQFHPMLRNPTLTTFTAGKTTTKHDRAIRQRLQI